MQAQTATTPSEAATGSKTLADLLPLAVEKHADKVAQRYKDQSKGEWVDVSYPRAGRDREGGLARPPGARHRARRQGRNPLQHPPRVDLRGLRDPRRRRRPWCRSTRPTLPRSATTCSSTPRPTAVIVEDAGAAREDPQDPRRAAAPRARDLDGEARRRRRDQLRRAAREGPGPAPTRTTSSRIASVRGLRRGHLHLHVRHDRPAQGLHHRPPELARHARHGRRRRTCSMEQEVAYLFLPLAHAFARLIQLGSIDVGATIVYWERDPAKIIPNLMEVKPTYFPSVPRMFEKIYSMAVSAAPDKEQLEQAIKLGMKVRQMQERGEDGPAELQEAFDEADEALFQNVRNLFGGRIKQAVTGAAPIAQEILEFFYACGVLVLEGWGMTETSTAATCNTLEDVPLRLGRQAVPRRRDQDRRRRRDPRARPEHLPRLLQEPGRHQGDDRRRLAAHRRHRRASTRTASSTSPAARRTSSSRRAARTSRRPTSRTASSRTSTSHRPSCTATAARS